MSTTPPRPGDIYRHGQTCRLITAIDATHVYSRSWPNGRTAYRDSFAEWSAQGGKCIGHEVRPDPDKGTKGGVFLHDPVSTTEYKQALEALIRKPDAQAPAKCATCGGSGTERGVRSFWDCRACGGSGKAPRGDVALANALGATVEQLRVSVDVPLTDGRHPHNQNDEWTPPDNGQYGNH